MASREQLKQCLVLVLDGFWCFQKEGAVFLSYLNNHFTYFGYVGDLKRLNKVCLEKPFLTVLREDSELHRAVSVIVVDESHTVEAWTGKRQDAIFVVFSDISIQLF